MNRRAISGYCQPVGCFLGCRSFLVFLIFLAVSGVAGFADDAGQAKSSPSRINATHILGFAGTRNNANGTLSLEGNAVQFQRTGKTPVQVKISSIADICLGDQSKQVGGLPMTLGKAAVPYGGGRAISLFAHKKYDILTLKYIDADGGFHGAIFEFKKGQGEVLRNELIARGAHVDNGAPESPKQTAETSR
jgi:hypothetical protein